MLLSALQLDIAGGSATKGFHTSQTPSPVEFTFTVTLPAGTSCPSNTFLVKQIVNGSTVNNLGNAQIDPANKNQITGKITATLGSQHLVFLVICLPAPSAKSQAKPLGLAKVVTKPSPSASASASALPIVTPFKYTRPASSFSTTIGTGVLTVNDEGVSGAIDTMFTDSGLGISITDYDFDVNGTNESNGGQDNAGDAQVTVTGAGTHDVSIDEELFPPMSDDENVMLISDNTDNTNLTFTADQELQHFTLQAGNQLSVLKLKGFKTKQAAGKDLDIISNPDGTWLVNGQGASTAAAAANLILADANATGISLHTLAMLYGLFHIQGNLIAEPTLSCLWGPNQISASGIGDSVNVPDQSGNSVTAHREFKVQQAQSPFNNLIQLARAIFVQRKQNLKL